jgi:hypothetical protein
MSVIAGMIDRTGRSSRAWPAPTKKNYHEEHEKGQLRVLRGCNSMNSHAENGKNKEEPCPNRNWN